MHVSEDPTPALRRDPALLVLLGLFVAVLAVDRQWMYGCPCRDPWIYFGYFENLVAYTRRFSNLYYSTRLSMNLPGFALNHLLPIEWANFALRFGLFGVSIASFYSIARGLAGRRSALLGAMVFATLPAFLVAIGWNYMDGFSIAYLLLALALADWGARSAAARAPLFLAGAAAAALVVANLFNVIFLPLVAAHGEAVRREAGKRTRATEIGWGVAGGLALLTVFGFVNRGMGGPFDFVASSLRFAASADPALWNERGFGWFPGATHLVFPLAVAVGAALLLAGSRWRREAPRAVVFWQVALLLYGVTFALLQARGRGVLQHFFYADLLLPIAGLALVGQLEGLFEALPSPRWLAWLGAAAGILMIPWAFETSGATVEDMVGEAWRVAFPWALCLPLPFALAMARKRPWLAIVGLTALAASQMSVVRSFMGRIDHRGMFVEVATTIAAIDRFDPAGEVRLWYDMKAAEGRAADAVASAFLLCPRLVNAGFPALDGGRMCDGKPLQPGQHFVILTSRVDGPQAAAKSLAEIGLAVRWVEDHAVSGPVPLHLWFGRVETAAPDA